MSLRTAERRAGVSRRGFLGKSSALMASGLAVGFHWPVMAATGTPVAGQEAWTHAAFAPNAWVRVLADNTVKIVVHKHDSGTGTHTALAACVAEELDVDPFTVEVISPEHPFYQAYIHPIWKVFSTGGSTSVSLEYERLRQAGATARAMLMEAAARQWGVVPAACTTQDGMILHTATGRGLRYGDVAEAAAQLPVPKEVPLKDPSQFKYIGKLGRKRDALAKATGAFEYSIDVKMPGLLTAVVTRAPVIGAKVARMDASRALAMPGVRQVLVIPGRPDILGGNQEGVAVLADDYWSAAQARDAVQVEWSDSPLAHFNSADIAQMQQAYMEDASHRVVPTIAEGDAAGALKTAEKTVDATYTMPYKAANPMEPMCVTAWEKDGAITYWGGVQVPSSALEAAHVICGLDENHVTIHELVSGGSFGAREGKYWLYEVAYLTHATGKPVKLLNAREDEMRALYGHAASYHRLKGAVNAAGDLTAIWLRTVVPASPEQWEPGYFERKDHMDYSTTESIQKWDFAYSAPNRDVAWVPHETGIPTGWYRAVSFIPNVFAVESFMDEMAHAAQRDPLEFRLQSMKDRPRHVAVLERACALAGWKTPRPANVALGIATNQGYNSYQAVVAELTRDGDRVRVSKLTCVVDCGLAVSPDGVREQIYGGLMWGMGHALMDKLDIRDGRVVQSNFHDYPVMRMADMPPVQIEIIDGDPQKPSGVGELTNTAVAPAIANAIFRLTGDRQRQTPFDLAIHA